MLDVRITHHVSRITGYVPAINLSLKRIGKGREQGVR
jgi:hypothetical protein